MKYAYLLKYNDLVLVKLMDEPDLTCWIEEHTCPENFLGMPVVDLSNGDTDPHGIFKVAAIIEVEEDDVLDEFFCCGNQYGKIDAKGLATKIREYLSANTEIGQSDEQPIK